MVVARVNIHDKLDKFIGSIKDNKGFNSKNEALNFIIKEYERMNGESKFRGIGKREEKTRKVVEKKPKRLQQNHINEIKSVLNGE